MPVIPVPEHRWEELVPKFAQPSINRSANSIKLHCRDAVWCTDAYRLRHRSYRDLTGTAARRDAPQAHRRPHGGAIVPTNKPQPDGALKGARAGVALAEAAR
jgi:hypothetical protein